MRGGVVPITQPMGPEWPIREDVILNHEENCIFCEKPENFASEAKLLLKDKALMNKIRQNNLDLYSEKLKIGAIAKWYWGKLKDFV